MRAYERRADLRANNSRLLDYVSDGGTLIVQYNKFEFNEAQYGPYPAKVTSDRVTDENAPVTVLEPERSAVQRARTGSRDAAWKGWVQERGLYFLGRARFAVSRAARASKIRSRPTRARSAARWSSAQYGKGRWVYVGLGLWRELPAGVTAPISCSRTC